LAAAGRLLIALGVVLLVAGGLLLALARLGLPPPGRLPGDLVFRWRGFTLFLPFATSLLASAALTLLLWLVSRLSR
jgi:hypothetical protein